MLKPIRLLKLINLNYKKPKAAYIGRNDNIHDKFLIELFSKHFILIKVFTKQLEKQNLSKDFFCDIDLVVAGPLTDAVSLIPKNLKVPIVGVSHGYDLNLEFDYPDLNSNIDRCDLVICDSQYLHEVLKKEFRFKNLTLVFPWVKELDIFFANKPNFSKYPRILVTRNWHENYRNDLILDAVTQLEDNNEDFSCSFIGKGPLLNEYQSKYRSQSTSKVNFLGFKTKTEIARLMSENWIYISAANSDGSSISLLEAMASGMICITSDFPSNLEWISDSENGFVFANENVYSLINVIRKVTALSFEEKKRISNAARQTISNRLNWDRVEIEVQEKLNLILKKSNKTIKN